MWLAMLAGNEVRLLNSAGFLRLRLRLLLPILSLKTRCDAALTLTDMVKKRQARTQANQVWEDSNRA